MATKNIFAGTGTKTTFVNIIYGELMKREFVTLADILCIYHKREKGYYEKMSCCSETGYGELKKAFPEVVKELRKVYPESVEDNGKIGKGRAYRYVGKDDDPLAEERKAVEQKRLEDYVAFCKASAGILPSSWFSAYFENTQLLLDTHREDEGGMSPFVPVWNKISRILIYCLFSIRQLRTSKCCVSPIRDLDKNLSL
jgi:hypothetical protein